MRVKVSKLSALFLDRPNQKRPLYLLDNLKLTIKTALEATNN